MTVAAASKHHRAGSRHRIGPALIGEWRELSGVGRLASAGVVLSTIVAVVLAMWIDTSVRRHLLDVRAEVIQDVVQDLEADGLLPFGASPPPLAVVDAAIEQRVIGGEITRVVIRDANGAVVYGEPDAEAGLELQPGVAIPHLEQHPNRALHYLLPLTSADGSAVGTFEAFQRSTSFNEIATRVRRNLWLAIVTGLGTLGIAMAAFTLSHARALDRRRRHAEQLLRDLVDAEDRERRRIVGYLHDDVGQPIYRVLYGLEGCRAGLETDSERAAELDRLAGLLRGVDRTLRNELVHLHRSSLEPLDLSSALEAVAQDCRDESGLDIEVAVDTSNEPSSVVRSVLLRAADEALTNVRRHANADHVQLVLRDVRGGTLVEVIDDGEGCSGPRGLGLTTVSERLEALGGGLSVQVAEGGGTVFRAWIPEGSPVPS